MIERISIPAAILAGLIAITLFALGGPYPTSVWLALPIVIAAGLALSMRLPFWGLLAFCPLLILVPPQSMVRWFDLVPVVLCALAFVMASNAERKQAWDLRAPGMLAALLLLAPLLALPLIVHFEAWIMVYKTLIMACLVFFGLRRVVPPERSHLLLYAFPLVGIAIAFQLMERTSLIGGLLTARPQFRAFYTNIGWGSSNYLGAIFVLTLGCSAVAWIMERRTLPQLLIAISILIQLKAFFELQSRGATVGLGVLVLFLVLGGGRIYGMIVGVLAAVAIGVGFVTPAGQVLLRRFLDPQESASWFERVNLWARSWTRFAAHPWTGIGLNQGQYVGDQSGIADSHNVFLQALMEQGIMGGVVTIGLIVGIFRLASHANPAGTTGVLAVRVRRAVMGVIAAVLLHAMIEPTLNGVEMLMLFAWFLGWLSLQTPDSSASWARNQQVIPAKIDQHAALGS